MSAVIQEPSRDDNGQLCYRLARMYDAPDFVKNARVLDIRDAHLPHTSYLDPVRRRFPVHTKAATWMSAASLYELPDDGSGERAAWDQALIKFAKWHGIEEELAALQVQVKEASVNDLRRLPDSDFAYCREDRRYYPLRNKGEIQKAAGFLEKHRDNIPYAVRRDMAKQIRAKAAVHNLSWDQDEDTFLAKQAGVGTCAIGDAVKLIQQRIDRLPDTSREKPIFKEAAQALLKKGQDARSTSRWCGLADLIDRLDRSQDWHDRYDRLGMSRPEDVLFAVQAKDARAMAEDMAILATGKAYFLADLEKHAAPYVADLIGAAAADRLLTARLLGHVKLAQAYSELDSQEARLLDGPLQHAGVKPVWAAPRPEQWLDRAALEP